jgi:hypothetical protein
MSDTQKETSRERGLFYGVMNYDNIIPKME